MKLNVLSAGLLFTILFFSCKKSSDCIADEYIPLKQCASQKINGENVSICFNQLLEDSRCPVFADCIWQGAARGNFTFKAGGQEASFNLSTTTLKPQFNQDTIIFGYKIHLADILPYPGEPGSPTSAKVQISK